MKPSPDPRWVCVNMPLTDYTEALDIQRSLVQARSSGRLVSDVLLLLEHPPVFTLGRRGGSKSLKVDPAFLRRRGIPIIQAERGGDITFHGPGQLVGYLIMNLKETKWDVKDFVQCLEEIMILTVADWDIQAQRNPLNHGIWLGMQKLGSIGIAVHRGISFHGFSLNVHLDLEPFEWIQPCGLTGIGVISMEKVIGKTVAMQQVRRTLERCFQSVFKVQLKTEDPETIQRFIKKENPQEALLNKRPNRPVSIFAGDTH